MAVRPRRRRRRSAPPRPASSRGEGDDRLSELPDELLLIVMRGLDTCPRSAPPRCPAAGRAPARAPGARLPRQRRAPAGGGATTSAPPSSSPSSEGAATTPPGGSSRHPWRGTSAATCGAWPSPSPASSTPACQQARGGVLRDERRPPHRLRPPADQHGRRLVGCRGAGGRHQARAVAPP